MGRGCPMADTDFWPSATPSVSIVSRFVQTGEAPTSYTDVMTVSSTGRRHFSSISAGQNAAISTGAVSISDARTQESSTSAYLLFVWDALDEIRPDRSTPAAEILKKARKAGHVTAVDLVSAQSGAIQRSRRPRRCRTSTSCSSMSTRRASLLGEELGTCDGNSAWTGRSANLRAGCAASSSVIHRPDGAVAGGVTGVIALAGIRCACRTKLIAGAVGAGDALLPAGIAVGLAR